MTREDLAAGDIVEVEVVKHEPWGVFVRLLPLAPDVPASIDLVSVWHEERAKPGWQQAWPAIGSRLPAMFERWSGSFARLTTRPAALAIARTDWGVVADAVLTLASTETGGISGPLQSGGSHLMPAFGSVGDAGGTPNLMAIVETLDGRDLAPGTNDLRVRLRLWPEHAGPFVKRGARFELRYHGPDGPVRRVGEGVLAALAGAI